MKLTSMTLTLLLCFVSLGVMAQTTSSISGEVTDSAGASLPGAVVQSVHEPTGTRTSAVSRADGRYDLRNLLPGGPYTVSVTMTGFKPQNKNGIVLKLGENYVADFKLTMETVEETMTVVASSNPIIDPSRTGAFQNLTTESLEKLPTINRSIADIARTSSYFMPDPENGSLAVSGRNNRYNSIQIDGSANTDLFGLAASNTPGGQTESQPISLDAIQELELIVSPYDVRYNGFTGGGINAVTRSGSNKLDGSVYFFNRDKSYVGDGPDNVEFGEFENTQAGARVGGPIIKDKLFYFVSVESNRQDQPADYLIEGETQQGRDFGHRAEAEEFEAILRDVYGYDPGGFGEFTRKTDSDQFFVRLDYNINETNRLVMRHNFVESNNHSRERNTFDFEFGGGFYLIENKTNSTVLKLNSTFDNGYNEARLNFTTIRDNRGGEGEQFPFVEVRISNGLDLRAGVENFSHANALDQDQIELVDEYTFFKGAHTITLGVNLQSIKFSNLFIQDFYGNYRFSSLDALRRGQPNRYQHSYSLTNDPLDTADMDVDQYSIYAGDEWRINDQLNLTLGIRGEVPKFGDTPTRNPVTETAFGKRTDVAPDGNWLWSPRVGFNYKVGEKGQLRGGIGVFSGRPVYVWLSNNYSNTGVEFARIDASFSNSYWQNNPNGSYFFTDPFNQPEDLPTTSATNTEYNLVDENFKYPQVMRSSLGYDQELPWWGMIATGEFVYTDNMEEILYKNLNLKPVGTRADGRAVMGPVVPTEGNAYYLTNTDKGWSYNATVKLERPSREGLGWSFAYTNGDSKSILDGTSSRAVSNFNNVRTQGNNNELELTRSDFAIKHRYVFSATYTAHWMEQAPTIFGLYYNTRSGRPYSNTYNGDVNGDRQTFNDLIYVPTGPDDINLTTNNWDLLNRFIEEDPDLRNSRGKIVSRNGSTEPWNTQLDLHIAQDIPIGSTKLQLSLDIQNVGNLIDSDSNLYRRVNFNNLSLLQARTDNAGNVSVSFNPTLDEDGNFVRAAVVDTYSRWYAKLGARLSF